MMAEEMKPRPHRREHLVDGRLARIDPASLRMKRTRGLVCEEHVDARESLALEHLVAHEMAPLVVAALPSLSETAETRLPREGGSAAALAWYQLGAYVPPSAATRQGPTSYGPPFGR